MVSQRPSVVNEDTLGRYQTHLRQQQRAESTIKGHLSHIRAALSWAKDRKLIQSVPSVKMPKRAKRASDAMKGRPITLEEFERMLAKTKTVVISEGLHLEAKRRPDVVASWKFYLEGLWFSGLRLEESMELHWTDRPRLCVEDLDCDRPMVWIPGDMEKGNRDRVLPMAPEFAEFLRQTPSAAMFLIEYRDGLKATVAMTNGHAAEFGFAARLKSQAEPVATRYVRQRGAPYAHHGLLLRATEKMIHTGNPSFRVERTLLTTGVLESLMQSLTKGHRRLETPHLKVEYKAVTWPFAKGTPPAPRS